MKLCKKCNTEKSELEFHKRKASSDGLSNMCKACQSEYDKNRANLPKRVNARVEYSKTDRGREAAKRARKKWLESNAIKRGVHVITGNAIRDGRLVKQKCEICCDSNVVAHHDDYAKPLNVRWLCAAHHHQWHAKNGEGKNAA